MQPADVTAHDVDNCPTLLIRLLPEVVFRDKRLG